MHFVTLTPLAPRVSRLASFSRYSHPAGSAFCKIGLAFLLLVALIAFPAFLSVALAAEGDFQPVPKLIKRVTDATGTLSSSDEAQIETRLKDYEARKGAQIAVLIVGTTQPETVFDYSTRVMTEWKLGRKDIDDGVLFVIAKNDRKTQILVGLGLSGSLTDAMSKRILTEIVAPKFRVGDFAGGIDDGIAKIISVIDGEALPPPPKKRMASKNAGGGGYENFIMLAIFAAVFVGPLLRSLLGRFLGASATGGIAAAAAWFVAGGLLLPVISGAIMFIAVLLMGAMNFTSGRGGGWGGGFGGGGGGSGADGGFSGGGGSFDGGGASGDW